MTDKNLEALATKLEQAIDSVKEQGTDLLAKTQRAEDISTKTKTDLDEALVKMNEASAEIDALKQAIAGHQAQEKDVRAKSVGEMFTKGAKDGLEAMRTGSALNAKHHIKAPIANVPTAGRQLGGNTDVGFMDQPYAALRVRDLLAKGRLDTDVLTYTQELAATNAAKIVAEGAPKPESGLTYVQKTINPQVVAHWVEVTRQALSDNGFLESQINQRLLYMLREKEEELLLLNAGANGEFKGLVPSAAAFDVAALTDVTKVQPFDILRLAMAQSVLNNYPVDGFVLNPQDLAKIQLVKDDVGGYIIGNPASPAGINSLWGVPTAESSKMTAGEFLGGNFAMGATLFDRWDATVTAGFKGNDFTSNLITLLAEERIALAVYSNKAFITGDVYPAPAGGGG